MSEACAAKAYRPRDPRASDLYQLVERFYEEVKGHWEERFERRYGYWRGFVDEQVRRYLDCGLFENGNAVTDCIPPSVFTGPDHRYSTTPPP